MEYIILFSILFSTYYLITHYMNRNAIDIKIMIAR